MFTVQVKLFATLRGYRPGLGIGEAVAVELPDGATVRTLARSLGVPEEEVKLVFVNGIARDLEFELTRDDAVGLFPPVGGG